MACRCRDDVAGLSTKGRGIRLEKLNQSTNQNQNGSIVFNARDVRLLYLLMKVHYLNKILLKLCVFG